MLRITPFLRQILFVAMSATGFAPLACGGGGGGGGESTGGSAGDATGGTAASPGTGGAVGGSDDGGAATGGADPTAGTGPGGGRAGSGQTGGSAGSGQTAGSAGTDQTGGSAGGEPTGGSAGSSTAGASGGGAGGAGGAMALEIRDLQVVENPTNVLAVTIGWSTEVPATSEVQVICGNDYDAVYQVDTEVMDHEVFVMGLIEGADCVATVTSRTDSLVGKLTEPFSVSSLPSYVPGFTVITDPGAIEPVWTLLNLNRLQGTDPPFVVLIVDEQGRVRWYHRRSTRLPGGSTDARLWNEGVLIGGSTGVPVALVDWAGDVVWEADLDAHHEVLPRGDDEYWYLTAGPETGGPLDCGGYTSDTLVAWDQPSEQALWEWRICDHYQPSNSGGDCAADLTMGSDCDDWAHVNAIAPLPSGDAMLLSVRDQNLVLKVDLSGNQDIEWTLGSSGDFTMDTPDWFERQHAIEITGDDTVLMYDNGFVNSRASSRAVEYRYDTTDMTAEIIWEYVPPSGIFTEIWGDVDRLPDGHTLVTFGQSDVSVRSRIVEVDAASAEVWELLFDLGWGVYRSERVEPPALIAER